MLIESGGAWLAGCVSRELGHLVEYSVRDATATRAASDASRLQLNETADASAPPVRNYRVFGVAPSVDIGR